MQAGSVWGVHVLDTLTYWRVEKLRHVRLVRFAVLIGVRVAPSRSFTSFNSLAARHPVLSFMLSH